MQAALAALDGKLKTKGNLLLGGGGAMLLAYGFPLSTMDLDALFFRCAIRESDVQNEIHAVADELKLPHDWLNPYFESFLYTLPKDYESRLKSVYDGNKLSVYALGLEDLLILKCFAGREKDIPHARAIIKKGADPDFVRRHIIELQALSVPRAREATDFLDDLLYELDL